ncbi:unnamed protein product [Parnassius mnemosyne]|uniref:Kazal-like domain-containing protein n=1 Tax=Parnassius mnemosyne TaxID=213953 RepID=A0AAV1LHN0_9NEOP
MWMNIAIYCIVIHLLTPGKTHLPENAVTPSNKIDQFCQLAETCIHDTIPICGTNGEKKRTFMDLCDLLEYACDTNEVYNHVDDMPDCPVFKNK